MLFVFQVHLFFFITQGQAVKYFLKLGFYPVYQCLGFEKKKTPFFLKDMALILIEIEPQTICILSSPFKDVHTFLVVQPLVIRASQ